MLRDSWDSHYDRQGKNYGMGRNVTCGHGAFGLNLLLARRVPSRQFFHRA